MQKKKKIKKTRNFDEKKGLYKKRKKRGLNRREKGKKRTITKMYKKRKYNGLVKRS